MLRTLSDERGVTVVVVTHDEEVARNAGRRIRLRDGRVTDTWSRPAGVLQDHGRAGRP